MNEVTEVENMTEPCLLSVEQKREENKKEDRKARKKYLIIVILATLAGMVLGFFSSTFTSYMRQNGWDFLTFSEMATKSWVKGSSYLMVIVNIIIIPFLYIYLKKQKKELTVWDGEDETVYESIDKKLSTALTVSSGLMIFNMMAFGIAFYKLFETLKTNSIIYPVIVLVFYIGSNIFILFYQKAIVNLSKELNPEKKGSVYDTKFRKKWLESCDEAEKQKIGEAAYATFAFMNVVYEVVSIILTIAGFTFPIGVLPLTIVCLLWLMQVVFYSVKAR